MILPSTWTSGRWTSPPSRDELLERVSGVDGLVCLITDAIDAVVLDAAGEQLKVVSQMAVGVDNVDVAACSARGIPVGNTPGVLTETTADMAWALILASARRVVEAAEYVKHGEWRTWTPTQMAGIDVYGSTLGIVGFGAIGQAIARRAQGFGMRVLYWNRTPRPDEAAAVGAEYSAFADVLAQSDFLCVSIALTDDTRQLIDAGAFELMKPGAILVNTARRTDRRRSCAGGRAARRSDRRRGTGCDGGRTAVDGLAAAEHGQRGGAARTSAPPRWRRAPRWPTWRWRTYAPDWPASRSRIR